MRKARGTYLANLESLRIDQPAAFWRLLKPPKQPLTVDPAALHSHYEALLSHPAPTYSREIFLQHWEELATPISADEVYSAVHLLRHNKALGTSWLFAELL